MGSRKCRIQGKEYFKREYGVFSNKVFRIRLTVLDIFFHFHHLLNTYQEITQMFIVNFVSNSFRNLLGSIVLRDKSVIIKHRIPSLVMLLLMKSIITLPGF
jgi:hypothetical protein